MIKEAFKKCYTCIQLKGKIFKKHLFQRNVCIVLAFMKTRKQRFYILGMIAFKKSLYYKTCIKKTTQNKCIVQRTTMKEITLEPHSDQEEERCQAPRNTIMSYHDFNPFLVPKSNLCHDFPSFSCIPM